MAKKINGSNPIQLELPFGWVKGTYKKFETKNNIVFLANAVKKKNDISALRKRQENIDKLINMAQSLNWRQWGE